MIKIIKAVAIGVVCFGIGFSDTRWQTTRNGTSSGYCGLTSNKITVTVHPYYADVVEEAEITTSGNIWNGDSKTLEISGTFKLSEGTALRSLLLWNGDILLKGKLLLREDADSAYENVVNRVVVRDPALIHYMGNNQYQFKIFPVEINNSRKIRILYTVPLQMSTDGLQFKISTAFTSGTEQAPDQIPVEILKSTDAISPCIIQHGSIKKTVQFGATYSIPVSDFQEYSGNNGNKYRTGISKPITITPVVESWNVAYKKNIDSGEFSGYYAAIFASLPDIIPSFIETEKLTTAEISIEAKITVGKKVYLSDMPGKHYLSAYIKSSTPWDSIISWTCYNNATGTEILKFNQKITCTYDSSINSMVPFIWGAKYSLKEGTGALGAQFGFVDSKMSLLALEKDSLTRSLAIQYQNEGVPVLNPEEIVITASKMPIAPKENAIFEYDVSTLKQMTAVKSFNVMYANGIIQIQFPNQFKGAIKGFIIDASGRVVYKFTNISKMGCTFNFKVPNGLKGLYIVKIQTGGENMQKKIMVY